MKITIFINELLLLIKLYFIFWKILLINLICYKKIYVYKIRIDIK